MLVDLAYGVFDRFVTKVLGGHMAGWHATVVTFFVGSRNSDKNPFAGFNCFTYATDFDSVAGARVNIVAAHSVFFRKYFCAIKTQFT